MIQITIPATEQWDEAHGEFVYSKEQTLTLEHSLVSLSKWESKWCKAFLSKKEKTREETLDYIKCMTLTQNVDPQAYNCITNEQLAEINRYIEAPMTATYFSGEEKGKKDNSVVTAELIYYWMIAQNIPFECQKWHLNRLMALIRVCNLKNNPPKKKSKRETISEYAALNEARKKQLNTKG